MKAEEIEKIMKDWDKYGSLPRDWFENLIETLAEANDRTAIKKAFESGWEMGHDSGCAKETMYGTTIGEDWKRYLSRADKNSEDL